MYKERFFRLLYDMYACVKSVVRQGVDMSQVIEQMVGLRQGCILSPCLFSIFIADLPRVLREQGPRGVQVGDVWLQVLLYADDGALLAESSDDLQRMLDVLKVYCGRWRMFVNLPKTKLVVFNRSVNEWGWRFFYDGHPIEGGLEQNSKVVRAALSLNV